MAHVMASFIRMVFCHIREDTCLGCELWQIMIFICLKNISFLILKNPATYKPIIGQKLWFWLVPFWRMQKWNVFIIKVFLQSTVLRSLYTKKCPLPLINVILSCKFHVFRLGFRQKSFIFIALFMVGSLFWNLFEPLFNYKS